MPALTLTAEAANQQQHDFITSTHRVAAYIGGVGSGKTFGSTIRSLTMPPGTTGMIVAPTYDMVRTVSATTMEQIAGPFIREYNKAELRMDLIDNKTIYFRSADRPDRLRGPNLGWIGLDEARDITEEAYLIALGRIRLHPEKLWVTTTPRPRSWLRDLAANPDTHTIRAASFTNPHLTPEFINSLKRAYGEGTDFYRQEVLGEFVDFTGAIYQRPTRYETAPPAGREATGCDFAYTSKSGDYTVFIRGVESAGILYITNMYRAQTDATTWALTLQNYPNPVAFIGGQEKGITQFLRRDYGINIQTHPAATDKLSRAQPSAAAWNRGDIRVPDDPLLNPWLEDFLSEVTSFTGNPNHDDHDDVVDALAALHHHLLGTSPVRVRSGGWT